MYRRYLFLGLMVALGAALVSLVLQGRKQEQRQQKARPLEIVKTSPATATRVLAPADLQILKARDPSSLEIRNRGTVAYRNVMVHISVPGTGRRDKGSSDHLLPGPFPPGEAVTVEVPGSPANISRCSVRILFAELP